MMKEAIEELETKLATEIALLKARRQRKIDWPSLFIGLGLGGTFGVLYMTFFCQ